MISGKTYYQIDCVVVRKEINFPLFVWSIKKGIGRWELK